MLINVWVEIKIYFSKIKQSNFILCFWKAWIKRVEKKKKKWIMKKWKFSISKLSHMKLNNNDLKRNSIFNNK